MFLIIKFGKIKAILLGIALLAVLASVFLPHSKQQEREKATVFSSTKNSETLIIDAGHGGTDGGAVSDNGTKESEINLAIAQKMNVLAHLVGIKTVMTRTTENLQYPDDADTIRKKKVYDQKQRVEQINTVPNAVLISVHQNMFPSSQPRGPQVLYAPTETSDILAETAQENLLLVLPGNSRTAAQISDSIYLMNRISCPAILVECGFLSNSEDEYLLKNENYQRKLSLLLICSYLQFTNASLSFAG